MSKGNLAIAYAMKRKAKKEKMSNGGEATKELFDTGVDHEHVDKMSDGGPVLDPDKVNPFIKGFRSVKAHGGEIEDSCPHCGYAKGGEVMEKQSGYEAMPMNEAKGNSMAMSEDSKRLGQHPVSMHSEDDHQEGIVDRIMKKRVPGYEGEARLSHGGQVANECDNYADFEPNEFDDLVNRDDLEFSYDGSDSGDELGNKQEDHDRSDIVARIMSSRKKKDKNPRPA